MRKKLFRHMSVSNRIFYSIHTVFWMVVLFMVIYPLYLVCISSISGPDALAKGEVIWKPVDIDFIGYRVTFQNKELWVSYLNSIVYTVTSVFLSIYVTLAAAYTLSRRWFPGKTAMNVYFLITMFFGGGLIPTFLLMRDLGLYNNRLIIVLMGCVSVWNMMVARTYIQTSIPEELYEAAVLDGASHFQYFFKVVFPLSRSIIAVLSVYYAVGKWNDYFTGLIYIKDRFKLPLQTILRELLAVLTTDMSKMDAIIMDENMGVLAEVLRISAVSKYCIMIVSTVPAVFLYVSLQRYFEKGVMIGSLKG